MVSTLNMQDMRYLNLFEKITGVQTRFCFVYNGIIIFSVPKHLVSKAVGEQGRNVKRMYDILGKKIKIIQHPEGDYGIRQFIAAIVSPFTFKSLEIKENEIILTAGSQSKAALIGRNKRRLIEMQKIIKNLFGKEFKIV